MRNLVAVLASVALACATGIPGRRSLSIAEDGRSVTCRGETWRAPGGVSFFQRGGALHVISLVPGNTFDVRVPRDASGRLAPPADAPFEVADGLVRLRDRSVAPGSSTAQLVDGGQLYRHDDHFHLTHVYRNADWQALYRARAEDSPLPPVTRQVAAVILAMLVDARIPGASEDATISAMRRVESVVAKGRRAVEAQLPAKQAVAMVLHDFEIAEGGRNLAIEGRTFSAEGDVRFSYCGDHFHVESPKLGWSHPVPLGGLEPGRFEMPPSVFFEAGQGGTVAERAGGAWRDLLASGRIRRAGDAWYVSEDYPNPRLSELRRAEADASIPQPLRERVRAAVMEILKVRLDIESDDAFRARLASVEQAIDLRWRELEREVAKARSKAGKKR